MEYQSIANTQLHFFNNCIDLEKEILQLYWELDNGTFVNTPKTIKSKFKISQYELSTMITRYSLLSYHLLCKHCVSYEKHSSKSQNDFNQKLQRFRNSSRYGGGQCDNCKRAEGDKKRLEDETRKSELVSKMRLAIKNENWTKLTNFQKEVLSKSLEMNFFNLKKYFGNKLGKTNYIKFIFALEAIEAKGLLLLCRDSHNGWIEDHKYSDKLLTFKDSIFIAKEEIKESEYSFNPDTDQLKLKLSINKEKQHPDSPLYSGIITFKEKIVINPNTEYVFAQWERANNNLYFTLIPASELEKMPEQKPISKLPKHISEGINEFLGNLGHSLEF